MVHSLNENVRQFNLAEREALVELRSGDVGAAINFYASSGRVVVAPARGEALERMVKAWSRDVDQSKDAAMFAWRRANVMELNRLAREKMAAEGRLTGPEIEAPGGARYSAGDRIVTLAPGADGKVVTSERGLVFLVDPERERLVARMDDGREQVFERDELIASKVAYGYATTVHRSQGATCERAHVYEDGGGRELAYVAMSRAKEQTQVYVAADDLDQAKEDLARSWQTERRWQWAIDTGTPDLDGQELEREPAALRREALMAERAALVSAIPVDVTHELRRAEQERGVLIRQLEVLRRERGWQAGGELGKARSELLAIQNGRAMNERSARTLDFSRKTRRDARHNVEKWAALEPAAERKLASLLEREEQRLTAMLSQDDRRVERFAEMGVERERFFEQHPEVPGRVAEIDREISGTERDMDTERRAVVHDLYPELERTRAPERDLSRDRGHDRGIERDDFGLGF